MGLIDFLIIVILGYFIANGFDRGLTKQIFSIANWLMALLLAFLLYKLFGKYLCNTSLYGFFEEKVKTFFYNNEGTFQVPFNYQNSQEQVVNALEIKGFSRFVANLINKGISYDKLQSDLLLIDVLVIIFTHLLINAFTFVFLFFVLLILIKLIANVFKEIIKTSIFGFFDKLGGAALSLLKGCILIFSLMSILFTITLINPQINRFLIKDLNIDNNQISIGKYFYLQNPLIALISKVFL